MGPGAGKGQSADDGRKETRNEQLDRNWGELLQELRVMQTGVQIIAGFLMTLPFQQRFTTLSGFERGLYLFLIALAAVTTILMLVPVSLHRRLFGHQVKATLVKAGDIVVKVVLGCVGMLIAGSAALIFYVVAGAPAGLATGAGLLVAVIVLLLVYPLTAWKPPRAP